MFPSNDPIREEETLMSELQGPRIPGEEGSRRRRPLGWIIGGLIALLIPFACQALGGGSDPQSGGSGAQERTDAQDTAQGGTKGGDDVAVAENTREGSKGAVLHKTVKKLRQRRIAARRPPVDGPARGPVETCRRPAGCHPRYCPLAE